MKRILAISLLLAGSVFCAFAEWSKIVCAGVVVPFSSTTITDWDEDFLDSEHKTSCGGGVDGQFRLVKDSGLALMFDADAAFVSRGESKGVGGTFLFGVGAEVVHSESWKLILSGAAGINGLSLAESDAFTVSGYDVDEDTDFLNLLIGADLFFSKNVSSRLALFAQCTVGVGIGAVNREFTLDRNGHDETESYAGVCRSFFCAPKIGVCWQF